MHIAHRPEKLRAMQLRIMEMTTMGKVRSDELELRGRMEEAKQVRNDIYFLCGMRQMIDAMLDYPGDVYQFLAEEINAVETSLLETWKFAK